MKRQTNYILTSSEDFHKFPANRDDTKRYADQAKMMTGSDYLPPVVSKGRLIPAGFLGTRSIEG